MMTRNKQRNKTIPKSSTMLYTRGGHSKLDNLATIHIQKHLLNIRRYSITAEYTLWRVNE